MITLRACLLLALVSAGCAHPAYHVGTMARMYRRGDCGKTLERAIQIEDRLSEFPLEKLAHYHIYRGACHVLVGQPQLGRVFLEQALAIRARAPHLITPEHGAVLDQAIAQLAQMGIGLRGATVMIAPAPAPQAAVIGGTAPGTSVASPSPECHVGSDGIQSCGYGCRLAANGHVYCSSVPGGQCVQNADGSLACP